MVSHKRAREIPLYVRTYIYIYIYIYLVCTLMALSGEHRTIPASTYNVSMKRYIFPTIDVLQNSDNRVLPTFLRTFLSNRSGTPCAGHYFFWVNTYYIKLSSLSVVVVVVVVVVDRRLLTTFEQSKKLQQRRGETDR